MKHALIVFSKVPRAGISKTRLTEKRGGILSDQEANEFYEAFLADVIHACAGVDADFYFCCDAGGDTAYLESYLKRVSAPSRLRIFSDTGGTFDQCMQSAADYILKNGGADRLADTVTIIGGDLPTLQTASVKEALRKLETLSATAAGQAAAKKIPAAEGIGAAVVEGACQEGGFSIVGYTCTTPFHFKGVFYNADGITALDMLVEKCTDNKIPLGIVEQVPDVDIPLDMAGMIPSVSAYMLAAETCEEVTAPRHTYEMIIKSGLMSTATPPGR